MTFTTFVTRTTFTGPRTAVVSALAGTWWSPVTSSTTGTRIAADATALSRLIRRRAEPEWSRECAAPTRVETSSPRGVSQSARSNGVRANSSASNSTVQVTPRANHDVTLSTRSKSTGHHSSTTPVDNPAAIDFERNSRTDVCLDNECPTLSGFRNSLIPAVMAADRRKLRAIRDRLRKEYGRPVLRPHRAPVDELILTVLSQNTNDRNRDVAYARLGERFSSWAEVRDAPVDEVEDAIRPGGLAPTKAVRIKQILGALGDDDLTWMEEAPLEEAREYLCDLPGVGRKTAACVLLFSYGRPEVPVDTHVYRVGTRLGLWPEGTPLERAHDIMLKLVDPEDAYEIHVLLIRHGRRTCTARNPDCPNCPLRRMCPYGRKRLAQR